MHTRSSVTALRELFTPALRERRFAAVKDLDYAQFIREKHDVRQTITFADRFEFGTSRFRFDLSVANRFLNLERLLGPSKESPNVPLVASPIHLLREDKSFFEWYLDEPNTVTDVIEQIDRYGIPFLETYSDLSAVKQRLESTSPADWFILTAKGRVFLLAAIALFEGDKSEALRLVESALEERKNELAQKRWQLEWWQLEKLHKRLIGS